MNRDPFEGIRHNKERGVITPGSIRDKKDGVITPGKGGGGDINPYRPFGARARKEVHRPQP